MSQATVSRAISELGDAVLRIGDGRSVFYSLIDSSWIAAIPVHRVDAEGKLHELGQLIPVRPEGFVMQRMDGTLQHSDSLPWWLADARPQGFLGRAFAHRHAEALGLPKSLADWSDRHALKALVALGHDSPGNVLLGAAARTAFLTAAAPRAIARAQRPDAFARLAALAAEGELPASSAGGEQPKFTAYAQTPAGARHVIVKFSPPERNAVTARWRDLLGAEHLALMTLREAGVLAANTELLDLGEQRFLQVERFDRIGPLGRRALHSLGSLDDEFVGNRQAPWPAAVRQLVRARVVAQQAEEPAALLYAYGLLIGNTDMHMGNLSFFSEPGQLCQLAPAYDMLPMGFAPTPSGTLRDALPALQLPAEVPPRVWPQALGLAQRFVAALQQLLQTGTISPDFQPCAQAIAQRLAQAQRQVERMAV
ncbi:serine/threonine protein kinase HipA of HipAB toxin-antitoxin module [Inhella inkyongensis]|uniref:Serine/threonine protein kinase HipA of HipAB toxin-antitoxin module n=1 Tax=Inhella inkyongensis TaxID=392593 RepID=A0A840S7F7_9BURK|nr:serine/threonine protein kinase HipA of HipAB toxin-antitoxin module [Inhella inkyongensis]